VCLTTNFNWNNCFVVLSIFIFLTWLALLFWLTYVLLWPISFFKIHFYGLDRADDNGPNAQELCASKDARTGLKQRRER